ncbi:MAG: RIP metalloprotease RseP [Tissierellia bacterium]|nr:RIP metalloprotease RseP [Tissierellia bacterium]
MKTIIIAIIMFLFLVLIHEFGHFIAAKISSIKVNEFAIGMGPSILKTKKGETVYKLNILPIGGYCAMEGEEEGSNNPRSFNNAHPLKRFFTILAGPMMNFLLAIIIYSIIVFNTGISTNIVGDFTGSSPAKKVGIKINDEIVKIDNHEIKSFDDIPKFIDKSSKDSVNVTIKRDGDLRKIKVDTVKENGQKLIGIIPKMKKLSILESIKNGFLKTIAMIKMIAVVLKGLFTRQIALNSLSGPVGIVKELGNQAQLGILNLLNFFAYISVNLGFFNLIPIPALDGSKLLSSLFEFVTGRKINQKLATIVTQVGFVFLLFLILLVSLKDVFTLF